MPRLKGVCVFNRNREVEVMDNVTTVGIELPNNLFSLHRVRCLLPKCHHVLKQLKRLRLF